VAFVLIIGEAERFQCGKQVASYLGLVPVEDSSRNRRWLGHITKQGSSILRFLPVEAAQVTVLSLPEWRRRYFDLMMRRGRKIATVAMARISWAVLASGNHHPLHKVARRSGALRFGSDKFCKRIGTTKTPSNDVPETCDVTRSFTTVGINKDRHARIIIECPEIFSTRGRIHFHRLFSPTQFPRAVRWRTIHYAS